MELEAHYAVGRVIGAGSYGIVREATERATGRRVAIKTVPRTAADHTEHTIENEIVSLSHLKGQKRVVNFIARFDEPDKTHMVTELCEGGSFAAFILDEIGRQGRCDEFLTRSVIYQMLMSLAGVHRKNLCHRDIKPDNWTIAGGRNGEDQPELRLIDFGLAHPIRELEEFDKNKDADAGDSSADEGEEQAGALVPMRKVCGSLHFMAPEMLLCCGAVGRKRYYVGGAPDVWATGVIMHIMLFGQPPFAIAAASDPLEVRRRIQGSTPLALPPDDSCGDGSSDSGSDSDKTAGGTAPLLAPLPPISSLAKNLLSQLLVRDPAMRLTAAQALRHSWFAEHRRRRWREEAGGDVDQGPESD